ncbi:MAG: L-threonylcarbamoyladenylate synthase [Pseudomonadota bacterium]
MSSKIPYITITDGMKILKNNEIVAFPTETVYGIGANAYSEEACNKIYKIKNRPRNNPLIIHCHDLIQAQEIAIFNENAIKIAKEFWPGPISLLLPKHKHINIINKNNTVCIRIPSHPVAQKLLKQLPFPLAAPSANISNHISATRAEHVYYDFKDQLPIIDENYSQELSKSQSKTILNQNSYGIESTIIDCRSMTPKILRLGHVDIQAINNAINIEKNAANPTSNHLQNSTSNHLQNSTSNYLQNQSHKHKTILSPGQLHKHYAPRTSLYINIDTTFIINTINSNNKIIYIIFGSLNLPFETLTNIKTFNLSTKSDLNEAARNLYNILRQADIYAIKNNIQSIYVQPIPNIDVGKAINDKLNKGSYK